MRTKILKCNSVGGQRKNIQDGINNNNTIFIQRVEILIVDFDNSNNMN